MTAEEAGQIVTALFDASFDAFVRYVCHQTRRLEVAEDLVQEAFLDLFRELRSGKTIRQPKAWMLRVLQRKVGREWRRHPNREREERFDTLEAAPAAGLNAGRASDQAGELTAMLSELSPREQEVVLLRMQSLKYREIAGVLGISSNTVNTLLIRALRKLQGRTRGEPPGQSGQRHVERNASKTLQ